MQIFRMAALLTAEEIERERETLPDWEVRGKAIVRVFRFKDFAGALKFVNQVGGLAETANHHPDIDIRWNQVRLELSTHSAGGLTGLDFSLARQIQGL